MKKNGFVFIETIIVVVFLSASLLLLYNSYSSSILKEKDRLYYDDIAYIYRTNFLRKYLETNSNIEYVKKFAFTTSYVITVGTGFETMFTPEQKALNKHLSLEHIINNFHIHQMILLKSDYITKCWESTAMCESSKTSISYNMASYLKTLNEANYEYYLVIEYTEKLNDDGRFIKCTPGVDTQCRTYYVSLGI